MPVKFFALFGFIVILFALTACETMPSQGRKAPTIGELMVERN